MQQYGARHVSGTLRDRYDWVVIGDDPGALFSGLLAAKRGWSTLFLSEGRDPLRRVLSPRFEFDPEPNFFLGFGKVGESSGLLRDFLNQFGLDTFDSGMISEAKGLCQLAMLDLRIKVEGRCELFETLLKRARDELDLDEVRFINEWRSQESRSNEWVHLLKEEWGGTSSAPKKSSASVSIGGELDRKVGFPGVSPAWVAGLTYLLNGDPLPTQNAKLTYFLLNQLPYAAGFRGGVTTLREMLLRLAAQAGATVRSGAHLGKIFVQKGRLVGVEVGGSGKMIAAEAGVLGIDSRLAARTCVVNDGHAPLAYQRHGGGTGTQEGWRFSVAVLTRALAIPEEMAPRLVWSEAGAPPVEVSVSSPADDGLSGDDLRIIHLRTLVPVRMAPVELRLTAARMCRLAFELVPFLEEHIIKIFPDFRVGIDDILEAYPHLKGGDVPYPLMVRSGKGIGFNTDYSNLYVASSESFPVLGSLGPFVAAGQAISLQAERLEMEGPTEGKNK